MGSKLARLAVVLLSCLAVMSCSSSSGPDGNGEPQGPTVSDVSLEDGATDVGLIQRIDVTFSEAMDPATINNASILVQGRAPIGFVEYDAATYTASFIPDTLYAAETWHEFVITSDVTNMHGDAAEPDTTSFRTGTLDNDHLDDYFEPNETPATAAPVEFGKRYHTLSLTGDTDQDLYEFTLTETAKVCVSWWLKVVDDMDWVFGFDNEDGEEYNAAGMAPATGDSASWYHFSFLPGTYYFHTYAHSGQTGHVLYDLRLTTDDPCRDDAYEDNDFRSDAVPISPGTISGLRLCLYDRDYFAVDLTAGDTLSATMTATAGYINDTKRVAIQQPNGNDANWTTSSSPTVATSYVAYQTGTHYIWTMLWNEYIEYDLEVSVR